MKMISVKHSSGNYPAILSRGIFDNLSEFISKVPAPDKKFLLIDQNVYKFHMSRIRKVLNTLRTSDYLLVPSGEASKSYRMLMEIHKYLLEKQYSRDSIIISIGGGVTGDLAGFAASTYMRGIGLMHVPTTIIAAADSSIGGKTGLNFQGIKNIIGTFHQPDSVIIDPLFFSTLSRETYYSGIGELIKYAFLSGEDFFNDLLANFDKIKQKDTEYLETVILKCIQFKAAVIRKDEKEKGLRKILNFGHTFGHGFESASGFKLSHGFAVHAGIISSLFLSHRLGLISADKLKSLLELPLRFKPSPLVGKMQMRKVYQGMLKDKKNKNGKVRFVLLSAPGKLLIDIPASEKEIVASVNDLKNLI